MDLHLEKLLAVGSGTDPGNLETEVYDVDSMEWSTLGYYPFETVFLDQFR